MDIHERPWRENKPFACINSTLLTAFCFSRNRKPLHRKADDLQPSYLRENDRNALCALHLRQHRWNTPYLFLSDYRCWSQCPDHGTGAILVALAIPLLFMGLHCKIEQPEAALQERADGMRNTPVFSDSSRKEHDHSSDAHGHIHGVVDPSIFTTQKGIHAVKWSFLWLSATALFQVVIVLISGVLLFLLIRFITSGMPLPPFPSGSLLPSSEGDLQGSLLRLRTR